MRTTLNLDQKLVAQAMKETQTPSKTAVIELGLRLLLERQARRRLKALGGHLPDLEATPRRRR